MSPKIIGSEYQGEWGVGSKTNGREGIQNQSAVEGGPKVTEVGRGPTLVLILDYLDLVTRDARWP